MTAQSKLSQRKSAVRKVTVRVTDSEGINTVSKATLKKLAKELGYTEAQALHYAASRLARVLLPAYEKDDGPLTDKQISAQRKLFPQSSVVFEESLF